MNACVNFFTLILLNTFYETFLICMKLDSFRFKIFLIFMNPQFNLLIPQSKNSFLWVNESLVLSLTSLLKIEFDSLEIEPVNI